MLDDQFTQAARAPALTLGQLTTAPSAARAASVFVGRGIGSAHGKVLSSVGHHKLTERHELRDEAVQAPTVFEGHRVTHQVHNRGLNGHGHKARQRPNSGGRQVQVRLEDHIGFETGHINE